MDIVERFEFLADLYARSKTAAMAVCAVKGGLDYDNYAGRIFVADILEMAVAAGEKALPVSNGIKPRLDKLMKEFARVSNDTTPSAKPIHKMTMDEFLRAVAMGDK